MALVVQTNTAASTALKHLNTNSANMNKSLERLSSGFRINSAADDATGFAVSSKLSSQSSRLQAAALNVAQAQAMVKTADAGVNEIQNMVVRLQSLTVQALSANNSGELGKLDAERGKLEGAINKIANSTKYNSVSLLNGTAGSTVTTNTFTLTEGLSAVTLDGAKAGATFNVFLEEATTTVAGTFGVGDKVTILESGTSNTQTVTVTALTTGSNTQALNFGDLGLTLTINSSITGQTTTGAGVTTGGIGDIATSAAANSTFQVGADDNANNRISVAFDNNYTTSGLALSGDISSNANASAYSTKLATALDTVITNRATLGASQNQLGFVGANLATGIEQITAAVSNIKDADMALEMANFTKNQILTQAGTSMLAQANQASQNVLSLFR